MDARPDMSFMVSGRAQHDSFVYDDADSIRLQQAIRERPASVRAAARAQNAQAAFNQQRCIGKAPVGDIHVGPGITYGHGWWTGKVIRRSPQKQRRPQPAAAAANGRRVLTSPRRGTSPGRMHLRGNLTSINSMSSMSSMGSSMSSVSDGGGLSEVEAPVGIRNSPSPHFWQLSPTRQRQAADPHHGVGLPTRDINPPKQLRQASPTRASTDGSRASTPSGSTAGPRVATPGATFQVVGQDVVPAAQIKLQEGQVIMRGEDRNEKDAEGNVVGTVHVIEYDAAIETFTAGVVLAVAADSWDLQDKLEEQLTAAKHAKAGFMKEQAQGMTAADPPEFRAAADLLADAIKFNSTDPELATLRGGALKSLGQAQQASADGGGEEEEGPLDPIERLQAASATFAEAASADPTDEEIAGLRIAVLKAIGQAAREETEEHPADHSAALAAFLEAIAIDVEGADEELPTLKEECEAALAEAAGAGGEAE